MRILDKEKIPYEEKTYEVDEEDLSGVHVAEQIKVACNLLFKTIVGKGDKTSYIVLVIPVDKEIDLKKAAKASSNKSIELLHVKDLLPITGYIRGGCSPLGMKKQFVTYVDDSAQTLDKMYISGGKRGLQIVLKPDDLIRASKAKYASLCK